MKPAPCEVIITSEPAGGSTQICGVSILERLLRQLQRLGALKVTVLSREPERLAARLRQPSWARADIVVEVRGAEGAGLTPETIAGAARVLLLSRNYYDTRLLNALLI